MKDYEQAYAKTMGHEGGYANDPDDVGGETYKGISRVFNPYWAGWAIIDAYRSHSSFPETLDFDEKLQVSVRQFFKAKYFDVFRGDAMPTALAMEMFDTAVNLGEGRAIRYLQTALNCLNKNGALWNDIVEDGSYGARTHKALYVALEDQKNEALIVKIINVLQGAHYVEYMRKSPTQEKYARGWLARVEFVK